VFAACGRATVAPGMIYSLVRPLLFQLDPERAHALTLGLLRTAGHAPGGSRLLQNMFALYDARLQVDAFGLRFSNPVGLAAGYDKNGIGLRGLSALGFGHIEIGTVTVKAQVGNPRPRVHRVRECRALINSMGFPNDGVDSLLKHTSKRPATDATVREARIGINIGKGRDTPLETAVDDYRALLGQVAERADFVTINVSSPNTLGLRQLQERAAMEELLTELVAERDLRSPRVPLLVKIGPDLNESELDDVLAAVSASDVDGIVATNTTITREGIPSRYATLKGGLSGAPLRQRASDVIRYLAQRTDGKLPLIGAGGIASAEDALERLRAGAWLIQVFTGLVYVGPGLVRRINEGLLRACEREGAKSVCDLVRR
jgi:dihydroorotate dehydrogenase